MIQSFLTRLEGNKSLSFLVTSLTRMIFRWNIEQLIDDLKEEEEEVLV